MKFSKLGRIYFNRIISLYEIIEMALMKRDGKNVFFRDKYVYICDKSKL